MAKFGPTLGEELLAQGLSNGLVWTVDEIRGRETLSPADQVKFDTVLANHDPTAVPTPVLDAWDEFKAALDAPGQMTADRLATALRILAGKKPRVAAKLASL